MREILEGDILNPISKAMLQEVLTQVRHQVPQLWDSVSFIFDADQLQFLDYSSTICCKEEQLPIVSVINNNSSFNTLNVACQTLESAIGFYWKWPSTESELFAFKSGSRAIKMAIQSSNTLLSKHFKDSTSILPYWGYGMYQDAIKIVAASDASWSAPAFTFSKDRNIFAQCHSYPEAQVITMGFCVKPILDFVNATILSFWDTRFISGPKRSKRLWTELLPVVLYLMNKLENLSHATLTAPLLFSKASLSSSRSMTASQIQFILLHELGHLRLDHIRKKNSGDPEFADQFAMEFEADLFAARSLITEISNPVGATYLIGSAEELGQAEGKSSQGISRGEAIHCLFLFLKFFEESKLIIKKKILEERSVKKIPTHPSPSDRLKKFKSIFGADCNISTELVEYWRIQLIDATRYALEQSADDLMGALDPIRLAGDHLISDDLDRDIALRSINSIQAASKY
jgi:hypothetical protein